MSLAGKVAIVTGGSRGIGRSIALQLAKEGANVIINYRQDVEGAEETKSIIESIGGYSVTWKADVSDYKESEKMIAGIAAKFGRIDILINNAGISKMGLLIDMTEEDWENIINTNLKSVFNCSKNALKFMLSQKSGNIINISSIWGNAGASCEVIYSASKGAVNTLTKALAKEVALSNIRVNAIAPGVIDTTMNSWMSEEEKRSLIEEIPMGRFGDSADIGELAAFLVSDKAKFITGQVYTVDGGML